MQKIVFLHIPKTAGTTLRTIMWRNYDAESRKEFYNEPDDYAGVLNALKDESTSFITGHFKYFKELKNSSNYNFTFLRNPVDRVISNYLHLRNESKQSLNGLSNISSFLKMDQGSNWQSKYLAGKSDEPTKNTYLLTEQALNNLHALNFVGITEQFNESLFCLSMDLNWIKIGFKKHNQLASRDEFDELKSTFKDEIMEANQADLTIYEEGLKLLKAQYGKLSKLELMQCRLRQMR